jgi:hypothetical protein
MSGTPVTSLRDLIIGLDEWVDDHPGHPMSGAAVELSRDIQAELLDTPAGFIAAMELG